MAENNLHHALIGQLEIAYRDLLVKLKAYVTQLNSQTDAMLCVKWIQKLQTLDQPNDIRLRNYLLLQICNQIRTGYLDHPFINLCYLDRDLNTVANCCRELELMCNGTQDIMHLDRSPSSLSDAASDFYVTEGSEIVQSVARQNIFQNENTLWDEPKTIFIKSNFDSATQRQDFYRKKYEETLEHLKKAKLKLYLKSSRSLEEFVEYLGANFIEKFQRATDQLLSIEKAPNRRNEFLGFQLNFGSKFKLMCGDLLNVNLAENLLQSEDQFQRVFNRILGTFIETGENQKESISTDHATISTDLEVSNTKYSEYLKRYIRKQQKQFNRKILDYEAQIVALKNEICSRDKKQSRKIIEMKCENIMRNDQKTRDQLSESINELESKYKNIVQQIFNDFQERERDDENEKLPMDT